jgi:hypothetical protein
MSGDDWALFGDDGTPAQFPEIPAREHARRSDPEASHDAARQLTTAGSHCLAMLRHFGEVGEAGATDEEAGYAGGLVRDSLGKRGADLRRLGLVDWVRDEEGQIVRRVALTGRKIGVSRITEAGREELRRQGVNA